MRKSLIFLALLFFCLGVGKTLHLLKDGFSPRRIHCMKTPAASAFNEEAKLALQQPFYYLGRGRQCFAFASADDRYVLKIPRTDIYCLPLWAKALPFTSYRTWLKQDQQERQDFLIRSFQIAFEELKEETGTVALHLGKSEENNQKITLIDNLGCRHDLKLSHTPFALQYKKPILMKAFLKAAEEKPDEAKRILDSLLKNIAERAAKGILNKDRSFLRNYGYENEKAFQIDIGSFFRKTDILEAAAFEKSFRDSTDPIREWLEKTTPEMLSYFQEKRMSILENYDRTR